MTKKFVDGALVDLTPEEEAAWAAELANPPGPAIPQLIEMRKAQLEMADTAWPAAGEGATLLDAVETLVAAGSRALQIEWAKGTQLSRTRDVVVGMQAALGIDDATMDALFISADARP